MKNIILTLLLVVLVCSCSQHEQVKNNYNCTITLYGKGKDIIKSKTFDINDVKAKDYVTEYITLMFKKDYSFSIAALNSSKKKVIVSEHNKEIVVPYKLESCISYGPYQPKMSNDSKFPYSLVNEGACESGLGNWKYLSDLSRYLLEMIQNSVKSHIDASKLSKKP